MHFQCTICLLLFISITGSLSSDWETFKQDYDKEYSSRDEEIQRRDIFLENVRQMKEYQRDHPETTFTMGINHLTDRRTDELMSDTKSLLNFHSKETDEPSQSKIIIHTWLDWRRRNVTTPVYNQGLSGSSAAIAAVEVIESYQAITGGNLTRGSVDQVITCCGNSIDALSCILNRTGGGICSQEAFNSSDGTCNPTECKPFVTFTEVKRITPRKESTMLEWIQDSPLYVVVDAKPLSFRTYQSGIYSDPNCSKTDMSHAMQLVGYGIRSGIPYWLLKNSWGEGWGEEGYMRMERGRDMCGITHYVVRIGTTADVNKAGRLGQFHIAYFVILCLFAQIFLH